MRWVTLECSSAIPNATFVKIVAKLRQNSRTDHALHMTAVKLWGTPSTPSTTFVAPGVAVAMAVGKTGVPYIVNTLGQIWSEPLGGAWTQVSGTGADAKGISLGPNDELYKISRSNNQLYKFVSNAWVNQLNNAAVTKYVPGSTTSYIIYENGMLKSESGGNYQTIVSSTDVTVGTDGTMFHMPTAGATSAQGSLV
jgi:hypothetical protein